MIAIMRTDGTRSFFERALCVASDGWAYEKPVRKPDGRKLVRRYPHNGVQTADYAVQEIAWDAINPTLQAQLLAEFRRFYARA